jgi:outer membrane scaffolding protein for murein synthesis (MipA/OmpV family)
MRDARNLVFSSLFTVLLMFSSMAKAECNWTDDIDAELGVGAAMFPWYMGSSDYRVLPWPIVDLSYKKFLFLSSTQGLGVRTLLGKQLIVGARLLYDQGRPNKKHARHMKNLAGSIDGGVFARYMILPWYIMADVQTAISNQGHNGTYGSLGAGYIYEINYNWEVNTRGAITIANERYMDSYFGVSRGEAVNTGFDEYSPDGGVRDFNIATVLSYYGIQNWRIFGSVGASVLFKEAGNSELVQDQLQWRLFLGASYKF